MKKRSLLVVMAVLFSFLMSVQVLAANKLDIPEVSWDPSHPGRVEWDEIEDAEEYEVVLCTVSGWGYEKKIYTTTVSEDTTSYDLCNKIKEDLFGNSIYVTVVAISDDQEENSRKGKTVNFKEADFGEYDYTKKEFEREKNSDELKGKSDNWVIFSLSYKEFHLNGRNDIEKSEDLNGWLDGYYYLNGRKITGWIDDSHYCDPNTGEMAVGFKCIDNHWYYFANGVKIKNGWYKHGDNWYYFNETGWMLENQWLDYKGDRYFLKSGGIMATGSQKVGNKWYLFDPTTGKLVN